VVTKEEGKEVDWRFALQTVAAVTVDMGAQQIAVFLGQMVEGGAFWQDSTDELVSAFYLGFLVGTQGVAKENVRPVVAFQGRGIGEFRAVVSQEKREKLGKGVTTEQGIQAVEDGGNGTSSVVVAQEGEEKLRLRPEEGEQDFAAVSRGQDTVHLRGYQVGVFSKKELVVFKRTV